MKARRSLKVAVTAAIASGAILASAGAASAAPTSGTEHFRIIGTSLSDKAPNSLIARGVFTAGGRDYSGNTRDLAVFTNGAFTIHHPNAGSTGTDTLNPKTCVEHFTETGPYTIGQGYGAYTGISGSGTYNLNGLVTLRRNANGTCSRSAEPTAIQEIITASGPVTL